MVVDIKEFTALLEKGFTLVDTRPSERFAEGFYKGAISIPFNENFLSLFEELIEDSEGVLLITDQNAVQIDRTIKASGHQNLKGILKDFDAASINHRQLDMLIAIDTEEFEIDYRFDEFFLVDVRAAEDFGKEHVEYAENLALGDLENMLSELDTKGSYYVYGATAEQAITAASLFKRQGFDLVKVVTDSFEKIKQGGLPIITDKKQKPSNNLRRN